MGDQGALSTRRSGSRVRVPGRGDAFRRGEPGGGGGAAGAAATPQSREQVDRQREDEVVRSGVLRVLIPRLSKEAWGPEGEQVSVSGGTAVC